MFTGFIGTIGGTTAPDFNIQFDGTPFGLLLVVLAGWMKANHESAPGAPIAIVAFVAVFSLIWGAMRLR